MRCSRKVVVSQPKSALRCLVQSRGMPQRPTTFHAERIGVAGRFTFVDSLRCRRWRRQLFDLVVHCVAGTHSAGPQRFARRSVGCLRTPWHCGCRGTWRARATPPARGPACAARLGRRCSGCPSGSRVSAVQPGTRHASGSQAARALSSPTIQIFGCASTRVVNASLALTRLANSLRVRIVGFTVRPMAPLAASSAANRSG
jgi:hypothetical protein